MSYPRHAVLVGISAIWLRFVVAQSSNVTDCIPEYQWAVNSLNQTPCLVAAYLESACAGPIQVTSIPNGTHYLGPDFAHANPCLCSSVTYSLISACGLCQNRTFESWTNWAVNCVQTEVAEYPKSISPAVVVPLWAYLDITKTNNTFDPQAAQTNVSLSTTFSTSSLSSFLSSTASQSTTMPIVTVPTASSTTTSKKTNMAGAIAGGVVGGLFFVLVVGLAAFWLCTRHRTGQSTKQVIGDFDEVGVPTSTRQMEEYFVNRDGASPGLTSTYPGHQHNSSMSTNTSPGSPVMSTIYTTYDPRRSTDTFPQMVQNQRPGFSGAAEI